MSTLPTWQVDIEIAPTDDPMKWALQRRDLSLKVYATDSKMALLCAIDQLHLLPGEQLHTIFAHVGMQVGAKPPEASKNDAR